MSSKTVPENKAGQESVGEAWSKHRERAPSFMREDEPRVPRSVGFIGLLLLALGSMGLMVQAYGRVSRIGPGPSWLFTMLGLAGLLFHASRDRDLQVRRSYGAFGFLCLIVAVVVAAIPVGGAAAGSLFLPYGLPSLALALLFLLAFAHNETDPAWHDRTVNVLGVVGAALAVTGFLGGSISTEFLLPYGLVLALLGLFYLWAFVGQRGVGSDAGYWLGAATGTLGLLVFLIALGRSALPGLLNSWGMLARPTPYLVPAGLLLMGLGLLYMLLSLGLCSDHRLIVMTRRELSAYFYSPIAYIMLFALTVVGWILFMIFVGRIVDQNAMMMGRTGLLEPIVRYYMIDWFPVICVIIIVPVLTMRLLSEEQRTGTLEVLLTAPVDETSVVLSKFLAAFLFYLFIWVPWFYFLGALYVMGGEPFDYRPLLSFCFALAATGAGFLAMGLFFSSLTRNQIAAAILTFVGMIGWTLIFFSKGSMPADSTGAVALTYMSYIDLWISALEGTLSPRYLTFHLSAAIFWLFLTTRVLEARRWT